MTWGTPHSGWLIAAAGAVLAVLLLAAWRTAASPSARRLSLLFLRACVLLALLAILADPVHVSQARMPPRLPSVICLHDSSRSMALDRPVSRQTMAVGVFDQAKALTRQHPLRISQFRFGSSLEPLAGSIPTADDSSRLQEALESLPARFGDDLPQGVFVFSDGRATDADRSAIQAIADGYKLLGIPIHVIPVGNPSASGDVAIRNVVAPRDAPPNTKIPVKVVVGSFGRAGERAEIQLRAAGTPNAPPLASLPVTLNDAEQTFDLTVESDRINGRLLVEVPPPPGEAFVENNRVELPIRTRNAKIRVIYMEGTLGNEYTFIRDALVEDPNIECLALEVNAQYAQVPTLHRVNDPQQGFPTTRDELFSYDVIICSDINRLSFTQQQLEWVVELVGQRGGGFAMIGGNTSFGAGHWDQTIWDGLIPVDMAGRQQGFGTIWNVNFRPQVPAEAEAHPIWRIVDDPKRNREILDSIPPLYGTNRTDRLKPAATVLAYSNVPVADAGVIPIITSHTFGKGRSFAFSPDSTVDWGRDFERNWGEGDNRYFRKFWRNVVRWLAENSAGQNRRLRIETDKLLYRPNEPLVVTAQAFDDEQKLTNRYRLSAKLLPGNQPANAPAKPLGAEEPLAPKAADVSYEGRLQTPELNRLALSNQAGRTVNVSVTAFDGDKQVAEGSVEVQVLDDSPEFRDPRPDLELLADLARMTDGKVLRSGNELAEIWRTYQPVVGEAAVFKVPLWDRGWLWVLLMGLLSVEWLIRRATGLA